MTKLPIIKAAPGLTLYETASRALAACKTTDEVKDWLDKAAALKEYARRAKNGELIADASIVKDNAERRLGEMLIETPRATGTRGQGRPILGGRSERLPKEERTLAADGITKDLSSRAQKKAKIPEAKFRAEAEERARQAKAAAEGDKAIVKAAKARKNEERRATRTKREADLAGKILALPTKQYGLLYADPEWRFDTWSEAGKDATSADNHYATSELETIKARPIAQIAAKDCVLLLWATSPMLPQALEVMAAWGFTYRSSLVWDKVRPGTGYWFMNQHELLLLGTRGKIPAPSKPLPSVITAKKGRHSVKPIEVYELLELYFPSLPKLELNARRARPGWDSWGFEAPIAEAAE